MNKDNVFIAFVQDNEGFLSFFEAGEVEKRGEMSR